VGVLVEGWGWGRAAEQAAVHAAGAADLDGNRLEQIVSLEGGQGADLVGGEPRIEGSVIFGEEGGGPVDVGESEPGVLDLVEDDRLALLDRVVAFLLALGHDAEALTQALVAH